MCYITYMSTTSICSFFLDFTQVSADGISGVYWWFLEGWDSYYGKINEIGSIQLKRCSSCIRIERKTFLRKQHFFTSELKQYYEIGGDQPSHLKSVLNI